MVVLPEVGACVAGGVLAVAGVGVHVEADGAKLVGGKQRWGAKEDVVGEADGSDPASE